jgi:protein TorT
MNMRNALASAAAVACLLAGTASAADKTWFPVEVESWDPPFDMTSPRSTVSYMPTEKPAEALNICVSVPHMKDAYWVAVDYGVTEEAKRQGVKMTVLEAGGYTNLAKQISQIEDCVASGAQAVILGAISGDGLNNLIKDISSQGIPVIDFMNGVTSKDIAAKSLVSFGEMGAGAGKYIAGKHPEGSGKVKVAWFPGPAGAGWVEAGNTGFVVQLKLVEDALQANPDITYIVGTAPTAEAAIQVLKQRGLSDKIKVVSYYITPSIHDAIVKKEVLAAPTDLAVIQARIAVDQAIRIIEKKDYIEHAGPKLTVIDQENAASFDPLTSVAPKDFKPVFSVE